MKLTTHLLQAMRLRESGAMPYFYVPTWHGRENFTIKCWSQLGQFVVIYKRMFHHNADTSLTIPKFPVSFCAQLSEKTHRMLAISFQTLGT
jgi:hypothetical protein